MSYSSCRNLFLVISIICLCSSATFAQDIYPWFHIPHISKLSTIRIKNGSRSGKGFTDTMMVKRTYYWKGAGEPDSILEEGTDYNSVPYRTVYKDFFRKGKYWQRYNLPGTVLDETDPVFAIWCYGKATRYGFSSTAWKIAMTWQVIPDTKGRVHEDIYNDGDIPQNSHRYVYEYDNHGKPSLFKYYSNTPATPEKIRDSFTYDSLGRILTHKEYQAYRTDTAGWHYFNGFSYVYDSAGNLVEFSNITPNTMLIYKNIKWLSLDTMELIVNGWERLRNFMGNCKPLHYIEYDGELIKNSWSIRKNFEDSLEYNSDSSLKSVKHKEFYNPTLSFYREFSSYPTLDLKSSNQMTTDRTDTTISAIHRNIYNSTGEILSGELWYGSTKEKRYTPNQQWLFTYGKAGKKLGMEGHVSTSKGDPLKNSRIYLVKYNSADTSLITLDSTITDTTGWYSFNTNDTNIYLVALPDAAKYPKELPTWVDSGLAFQDAREVKLDTMPNTINFHTLAGSNPGGSGFIGGKIVLCSACKQGAYGKPVAGLRIILTDTLGIPVSSTYTDNNGDFLFKNIQLTGYKVWVDAPNVDNSLAPRVELSLSQNRKTNLSFTLYRTFLEINASTGINNFEENTGAIDIFPNPVGETLYVKGPVSELSIIDASGRILFCQKGFKTDDSRIISMKDFPGGMYIVRITSQGRVLEKKVFRQ